MTIRERMEARVRDLNKMIEDHDDAAKRARTDDRKRMHEASARAYAQCKLEIVRILVADSEAARPAEVSP